MKFSIDNIKTFLIRNWKYLTAAVAFILIVIILVSLSNRENKADQQREAEIIEEQIAEQEENVEQANSLSTEEHPEINNLIQLYFDSMANNDVESLKTILAEMHPEDEASVKTGSEYTESYNNIVCYTKPGKTENSYVVFACYEAKFVGINTTAPGLLSFYVQTKEDGSLYIQNKLEDGLKEYIQNLVVEDSEVANLFEASQKRYEQALADDATLKEFVASLESGEPKTSEESAEQTAENTEETTEQTAENTEETTEQKTEETAANEEQSQESSTVFVKAKENVNVRNDASETADPIGKLLGGETAEKTGEKDGWICINYKGQPGYVKADFVETTSDGSGSVSKETTESSSAEKEYVYVKETVNIREGMSQDSKRVGTAYAGDKYVKIESYAEGWTKIEYNGKEAYIKTEFLETR
jgi:uncharacterized protein YgiM (DUF1202 family)